LNLYEFVDYVDFTGVVNDDIIVRLVGSFTKGVAAQMEGANRVEGWCLVPAEDAIILSNGTGIIKVDLVDGTLLASRNDIGFFARNNWTTTGKFAWISGSGAITSIRVSDLSTEDTAAIASWSLTAGSDEGNVYDPRGHSIIFGNSTGTHRIFLDRATRNGEALSVVVSTISAGVGLEATDLDVTDLVADIVDGYSVTRQMSARQALEPLRGAFIFDGVESDWIVKFKKRSTTSLLTVLEQDIGKETSGGDEEFVKEVRIQPPELPMRINVHYTNAATDYEEGLAHDKRMQDPAPTMDSLDERTLELPIVMSDDFAKKLAQKTLYTAWAEAVSFETTFPWKYLKLDPTDVFTMPYEGDNRLLRLGEQTVGANLETQIIAVQQDSESIVSTAPGGSSLGFVPQVVPSGLPTRLHHLNLPVLLANNDGGGLSSVVYWAASGYDVTWPGAQHFQSQDGGNAYSVVGISSVEATWGVFGGIVPDPEELNHGGVSTWDFLTSLNLKPIRGTLTTATELEVLNGENALAVVKLDGTVEIISFVTATVVDTGTIAISQILRGMLGTAPYAYDHTGGEFWVLLGNDASIHRMSLPLDLINQGLAYRGVTLNTSFDSVQDTFFTYTGEDLKPYAPPHIVGTRDGSGNLTVTWGRDTRFNGELRDSTGDTPLNEESELYDIEILNAAGELVVSGTDLTARTFSVLDADWTTSLGQEDGIVSPIQNASFEEPAVEGAVPTNWTYTGSGAGAKVDDLSAALQTAHDGDWFLNFDDFGEAFGGNHEQLVDLRSIPQDLMWGQAFSFTFRIAAFEADNYNMTLEWRDEDSGLISTSTLGATTIPGALDGTWELVTLAGTVPEQTREVTVIVNAHRSGTGGDRTDAYIDDVKLILSSGIPPVTVRVWQKSAIVGRGKMGEAIV
jgi:hypothetical protein